MTGMVSAHAPTAMENPSKLRNVMAKGGSLIFYKLILGCEEKNKKRVTSHNSISENAVR